MWCSRVVFERCSSGVRALRRISPTPTQTRTNEQQHTTGTIECGEGYVGVPGKIECPSNATDGGAVNVIQNRNCVERICEAYELPEGYRDSANSTISVLRLRALTDPIRDLYCEEGYTGTNLTVYCGLTGGTVSVSFSNSLNGQYCRENICRSISMTSGIVKYGDNGCVNGERLSTRTDRVCEASCSSGYDFDTGHLVCLQTARDDDDVVVQNLTCTMSVGTVSVLGSNSNGRRRMSSSSQHGLVCNNDFSYNVIADSISTDAQNQKLRFEPFRLNHGDSEEFFLEIEGQEIDPTPCVRGVREYYSETNRDQHSNTNTQTSTGTRRSKQWISRV